MWECCVVEKCGTSAPRSNGALSVRKDTQSLLPLSPPPPGARLFLALPPLPSQTNLGAPNQNEALAVDARQELDLKVWRVRGESVEGERRLPITLVTAGVERAREGGAMGKEGEATHHHHVIIKLTSPASPASFNTCSPFEALDASANPPTTHRPPFRWASPSRASRRATSKVCGMCGRGGGRGT